MRENNIPTHYDTTNDMIPFWKEDCISTSEGMATICIDKHNNTKEAQNVRAISSYQTYDLCNMITMVRNDKTMKPVNNYVHG